MRLPNRTESLLLIFVVVGSILRFWNIGFQHTNYDEQFTISFAATNQQFVPMIINMLNVDYTPPLYYIAAHFSMFLFGETATAIRIPSAIAGVALIIVMYFVGREYRDDLFGLLLSGFTTISYTFIFYSKYGRAFSLELLLFAVAFYFFMRVVHGHTQDTKWWALFCVLTMWTHLYAVFGIVIMMIFLLVKGTGWKWICAIAAGCLPLANYIFVILQTRTVDGAYSGTNNFSATPMEIAFLTPFDMFAYAGVIIFPIVVWMLWKNRNDAVLRIAAIITVVGWASMFIISFKTPVILHYILFCIVMLLLALILPLYDAIRENRVQFHHLCVIMVILILEAVQIVALGTVPREIVHFL